MYVQRPLHKEKDLQIRLPCQWKVQHVTSTFAEQKIRQRKNQKLLFHLCWVSAISFVPNINSLLFPFATKETIFLLPASKTKWQAKEVKIFQRILTLPTSLRICNYLIFTHVKTSLKVEKLRAKIIIVADAKVLI